MKGKLDSICKSSNWGRCLSSLLVVALLLPLVAVAPVQAPGLAGNVQPLLLQMAVARPEAKISVIVQKTVKDSRLEDLVARLGGTVTSDLHIINAFAAELPGKLAPERAHNGAVRLGDRVPGRDLVTHQHHALCAREL